MARTIDEADEMAAWERGYDQAVCEVLSELDPGLRARLRLKFRGWDAAWRRYKIKELR